MRNNRVRRMNGISILGSVTIVLALISNYVTFGTVNINLALIPIVIGACIYGPGAGFFLGCIDGALICIAPSTLALFMTHNAIVTIILCLLKTGLGGYLSGLIYKIIHNKNELLSVILAALVLPIVNTGMFLLGVFAFFLPVYANLSPNDNVIRFVIGSTLTINFLIEFIVNLVLSPTIHRILKIKL